jgi:hypothetical protein
MKLRGIGHNSYIHVSVSDLYIPRISLPTVFGYSKIGRLVLGIYKSLTGTVHECGNWETEHYNSVLEITRPFSYILGIHESE